jgi:hypothetical protein
MSSNAAAGTDENDTPFRERENWSLSRKGHESLVSRGFYENLMLTAYPGLDRDTVEVENLAEGEIDKRDTNLGIDVEVSAKKSDLTEHPLRVYVQERVRKAKYRQYEDATITVENFSTGRANEFCKTAADYNVYGYYDPVNDRVSGIVYETTPIQRAVINDMIDYEVKVKNRRVTQKFVAIPFDAIRRHSSFSMLF